MGGGERELAQCGLVQNSSLTENGLDRAWTVGAG